MIHTKLNTDKQARSALLKKGGAGGFAKHTLFSKKGCPVGAAHTVITLVWASHRRKKWSRSCRRSLSLNTAASSAGLTAPRINKMLCGGHRVCHFAGGQRICVWPICSSRAGVELRREQPMGTRPKTMMVGKGRFRRPCSALQRSEPRKKFSLKDRNGGWGQSRAAAPLDLPEGEGTRCRVPSPRYQVGAFSMGFSKAVHGAVHALAVWAGRWSGGRRSLWERPW